MNVRTFMLLFWSDNHRRHRNFLYFHFSTTMHAAGPVHLILHLIAVIMQFDKHILRGLSLRRFILPSFIFCPISDPNILLSILFSDALSLGVIITHRHTTNTSVGLICAYLFMSKLPTRSGYLKGILRKSLK
jgi:hypothetical protein